MLRVQSIAALLGFAALTSAATPLDCKTGASNGTSFTSGTNTYDILCNYQYGGDTIGASKAASTFEICVGFCDTTTGCVDVVYDGAAYCYLKSSKTTGYASPNWYTAVKRTTTATTGPTNPSTGTTAVIASPNCADGSSNGTMYNSGKAVYDIICNYQYTGDTIGGSKYADTFAACIGFCDTTSGCVDVVYSSAKYCWLKSSKVTGYASPNWWVAVKHPGPGPNLVQNPGFEDASAANSNLATSWSATGRVNRYPDGANFVHSGNAYVIFYAAYNTEPATISQTIKAVDTTQAYSLSFYYWFYYMWQAVATDTCVLSASVDGTVIYSRTFAFADGSQWPAAYTKVTVPVTVKQANPIISFSFDCRSTSNPASTALADLMLDDVSFNTV